MSTPASPLLSPSQLAALAEIGEERSAPVGELLYRVGDRTYPFIAILEGEVAIIDAAGNELIRHGPSGFLGELNLLSGQTVFVNALVTEPLRYIAVERGALRSLLNEDGPLSDLLLSTFISRREALQSVQGIGLEIVGPHGSEPTMRMLEFARANRLPYTWEDAAPPGGRRVAARAAARRRRAARSDRRPGAARARDRARARASRGGRPADRRRRPGGPRGRGLRRLRRARHARRREHRARRPGRVVPPDRELPRLPRRDQRHRADQPRSHPGAQVQRAHRDPVPRPLPRTGERPASRPPRGRPRDRRACRPARDGCSVPAATGRPPCGVRGTDGLLRRRGARGPALRRLARRGGRRRQLRRPGSRLARPRRRARHPPPPPRRPPRDDVRLPRSTSSSGTASPSATEARSPRSTARTGTSRPSR